MSKYQYIIILTTSLAPKPLHVLPATLVGLGIMYYKALLFQSISLYTRALFQTVNREAVEFRMGKEKAGLDL